MPVMTDRRSVLANTVSANVCAGKLDEFVARPSIVRLYATGAAVGLNVTFLVGGGVPVVNDQEVNAQNRMPIRPDDFVSETVARAGSRIVVTFRNTTGGNIDGFSTVEIVPIA